ncbi:TBC1 domain family member 5 [Caerostris darwini]|uniref:TBC1 domain family member 5 n=1 Tax=Caerostris darwini TaxID=1538125 RepID=A0AAV4VCQ1_9ARAC|nr:TBC1 domain family member 5 [Caerostris darwini]
MNFNPIQYDEPTSFYQKEWDSLFSSKFYLEQLKSSAMKGKLQTSHFRSIFWKLFLQCLPENQQLWIETAKSQRQQYEEIMDKFDTNPRNVDSLDVTVNNPLSQSQQNPWNQYFQDSELKVTIQQDVVRTFPEIEFFHTPNIQKMMINILFSYAREFPHISYKQGMHELLAPIIFVLHYDQQAYLQASETDNLDLDIHILLNQNYIEHDAFFMFCQLMESVEAWYTVTDYFNPKFIKQMAAEPFSGICAVPGNLLGCKLKRIYEQLLKLHDLELFLYFEQQEITPQIFGIRWLRLLFGREFTIHDLLIVWDAIFADSSTFQLVDYIFVAMLISIRDLLLQGDYASCLSHLMHFPNVVDVHYIVDLALHLRDPDHVKKPERKVLNPLQLRTLKGLKLSMNKGSSKNSYTGIAKVAKPQTVLNKYSEDRPKSLSISSATLLQNNTAESHSISTHVKSSSLTRANSNASSDPDEVTNCSEYYNTVVPYTEVKNTSFTLPRTRIRNVMENKNHNFYPADITCSLGNYSDNILPSDTTYREMVPLVPSTSTSLTLSHKEEYLYKTKFRKEAPKTAKELMAEISELNSMSEYCTNEITKHLDKLQECIMRQKLLYEDEIVIALAGMKRARDILKGTVSFKEVLGYDMDPYCAISPSHSKLSSDICRSKTRDIQFFKNGNDSIVQKEIIPESFSRGNEDNIETADHIPFNPVIENLDLQKECEDVSDSLMNLNVESMSES